MAPKKPRFVLDLAAPPARLLLVDQAGGEVGVDRHLLAGHGVQVEARGDFGDAAGALGDDHEVHDHQDREHDHADHEIAAHHEIAERLDDVAGGRGAFVAVREDQPRRGEVERQPQHGRDQQHGREGGELERRLDEQRRHQDQHREDDRERQRDVEQHRRQRQDQHHQDQHHADREREVAALEDRADLADARQREFLRGCRCYVGHVRRTPRRARSWAPNDCCAAVRPLTRVSGTAPASKGRPRSQRLGKLSRKKLPPSPGQDLPCLWLIGR